MHIALVLFIALVLHWALRKTVDRFAQHAIDTPPRLPSFGPAKQGEKQTKAVVDERRHSRIRTLASVLKSGISIVVWLWVLIDVLATIGINVAPLIASAGVVGVALGFGAQSLVKDFLSGVFMLLEDQYGVGDTIDCGDVVGTVEDVSLRLTTVRDIDGTLWFVRNGQILRVGNFSQGFAVARIDIPVDLDNDVDLAKQSILRAAEAAAQDPEIAPFVQEAPVLDGIAKIDVDHMIIRVRLRTDPGKQWSVQREVYARIIPDLRESGIKTAYSIRKRALTPKFEEDTE